jgi:hypothetical protein
MTNKSIFLSLFLFHLLVISSLPDCRIQEEPAIPVYDYIKETSWMTMNDGVRLSAAFYRQFPHSPAEMIKKQYVSNLFKSFFSDIIVFFFTDN